MDILINELSLNGQYDSVEDFLSNSLSRFSSIIDVLSKLKNIELLKKYDFYNSKIIGEKTLHDILIGKISREYDQIRRFKSKLSYLMNDPFWESSRRHSDNDEYVFQEKNVNNSSLAESCERDRVVISFYSSSFTETSLSIYKNSQVVEIQNVNEKYHLINLLKTLKQIPLELYVKFRFKNTKLNFSFLDQRNGFSLITDVVLEKEYLNTFEKFISMDWDAILKDKGLDYKRYSDQDVFKYNYKSKSIFKFRTSRKFRCFGYREGDIFYVVHFEIDHKLSDKG